ncbi:ubiquitin-activating enzyme e1, putative, partial [Ichthyophthirius multifiliis]
MEKEYDNNIENSQNKENFNQDISMFGNQVVQKLKKLHILIYGLKKLGTEIAKNAIFFTVEHIKLYDKDINLSKSVQQTLQSISKSSKISIIEDFQIEQIIKNINIIIITEILPLSQYIQINQLCRQNNIGFILACNFGLFATAFVDFGLNYKLYDRNGEDIYPFMIQNITKSNPGEVTLVNQQPHKFFTGDFVCITEVEGMYEINGQEPRPIKVLDKYSFTIEDTSHFQKYTKGGFAQLVKVPKRLKFESLKTILDYNKQNITPISNKEYKYSKMLHYFWKALLNYFEKYEKLPSLLCEGEELQNFIDLYENKEEVNIKLVEELCKYCTLEFYPMSTFWASVISKEILSFCGKYEPIFQIVHLDFLECKSKDNISFQDIKQYQDDPFFEQIALIGIEAQKRIQNYKIALFGAGSNGCEMARNLINMGACTDDQGVLKVIDQGIFKKFNLNHHQWITESSLNQIKVDIVEKNILNINKNANVLKINKNADKSSDIYLGDIFWKNLDIIINCTDKIFVKQYLQDKSLWFDKILIDQSLNGLKGNIHLSIPDNTQPLNIQKINYSSGKYDFDKDVIQKFPYLPIHSIIWAKELFDQIFVENFRDLKQYLQHPQQYINQYKNLFKTNTNFQMKMQFNDKIVQLLKQNMPNEKYEDEQFWVGYKRIPQIFQYSSSNRQIVQFITSTTKMFVNMFNLETTEEDMREENLIKILEKYYTGDFEQQRFWIKLIEDNQDLIIDQLIQDCSKPETQLQLNLTLFDSDDDFFREKYIEFLESASNLRCAQYGLQKIQKYKVENIAFEMNRRSLFTQSIITSVASMQLYMLAMQKDLKDLRNFQFDLTQNQFYFYTPQEALIKEINPEYQAYIPQLWQNNPIDSCDNCQVLKMNPFEAYEHESGQQLPESEQQEEEIYEQEYEIYQQEIQEKEEEYNQEDQNDDQIEEFNTEQAEQTTQDENQYLLIETDREYLRLNKWNQKEYRIKYTNGDLYEGEYDDNNNVKDGWGCYYYQTGEKYEGFFEDDIINGFGRYWFLGGHKYEGDWKNGKKHGVGLLEFNKGDRYFGDFINDLFDGQGEYTQSNKNKYEGNFKNGLRHGRGTQNESNGRKIIGEWKRGE